MNSPILWSKQRITKITTFCLLFHSVFNRFKLAIYISYKENKTNKKLVIYVTNLFLSFSKDP